VLPWNTQDQRNRKSNDHDSALTLADAFQVRNRAAGTAFLWLSQSLLGAQQMQEYRAYVMGPDGRVQSRVDIRCDHEAEAIRLAKQLVDGHDVELWQLDRQIETFRHTSERPLLRQSITADRAR
jgi:hypothetical protein